MIYNYISSDIIIAKVMADLNIQEEGQRVTDMREWIFEALEKIGSATQYLNKESNTDGTPILTIRDYQAPLPSDLFRLKQVAYSIHKNGPWQVGRSNTGSFKNFPDKGDAKQLTSSGSQDDNVLYSIAVPQPGNRNMTNFGGDVQYFLKPGYIVTNRRNGYLKISYSALVTDDRDYPMVPDLASFQEAVYWYIVWKLKQPEFISGKITEGRYYYIQNRWNFYRNQAYAEAMMPGEGEMISIKNNWLKLFPEIDEEKTFYSATGEQQQLYNNYYGRVY